MKNNLSKKELKDFGLLIGFCFPIFIGIFLPIITGHEIRIWTLYFGIIFISLSIIKPLSLTYFYKAWMKLGLILGWINSRLILGLVFFLILFPISLFMKLWSYDPLRIRKNITKSYRENKKGHKIDLEKIF